MRYELLDDDIQLHLIVLESAAEMDRFFDPFNPNDQQMPSHLFHAGFRYIREDVYDWLVANVGPDTILRGGKWETQGTTMRTFYFLRKADAMKFKLAYA